MNGTVTAKKIVTIILKTLTTVFIFWLIAQEVDLAATIPIFDRASLPALLACLLLAVPFLMLDGMRWQSVIGAMGHHIKIRTASLYMLVGMFFINLAPSFIGFDAFRATQMRRYGVPTDIAISSVVIDRLCSFATLPFIIALGIPHALALALGSADQSLLLFILIFSIAGLSGALLFGKVHSYFPAWLVLQPFGPIARLSNKLWAVLTISSQRAKILLASTLVHVMRIVIVFSLAKTLGIGLSFIDCFALVPISLLVAMIPISLASWGVREAAFIFVLGFSGVAAEDALALSLLFGAFRLTIGAIGGLAWLISNREMYAVSIKPTINKPAHGAETTAQV